MIKPQGVTALRPFYCQTISFSLEEKGAKRYSQRERTRESRDTSLAQGFGDSVVPKS
jgi:hypothetical protein